MKLSEIKPNPNNPRIIKDATIEEQKMLAIMGLSVTQIKDLIPLVQDFSTATGMDLGGAANLVGKSIGTSTRLWCCENNT